MKERKGSSATDEYEPWSVDLGHSSDCQSKAPLSLAISFLLATQTTGRTESRSATKGGRRRSMEALRASYGSLSEDSDDDSSLERSKKRAAVSPPSLEPQLLTSWIRQLWIGNFMAYHFCRKDMRPLKLHPELEKLLKEEFRFLDDFRAKSKAMKDCSYSAIGASKDEIDSSESSALAEAAVATSSLKLG
ncbi:uncharacterized protein LOC116260912 [Nymphaea colorata]|nr:uncharacterized protein LOC116260912 [Nymphaea colorata]